MESSRCPKCGDEPIFIEQVERWYCYGCNTYLDDASESERHDVSEVPSAELPIPSPALKMVEQNAKIDESQPLTECKNCGASLQSLKDGRQFCFVCETYQDEIKPEPKHIENEAQSLVNRATAPVAIESKHEIVSTSPTPVAPSPPTVETARPVIPPAPPMPVQGLREKPVFVKMCVNCGQPMKFIDKYQRYYCYGCKKYGPKDEKFRGAAERKSCPDCGGELRYIDKYNEHYCNACKTYPLRARRISQSKSEVIMCPKCAQPLKWIDKYERHYCYECKEYAPKGRNGSVETNEKKPCPACNENMKYVSEYNEWYCFNCRKYSLRPSKPALLV